MFGHPTLDNPTVQNIIVKEDELVACVGDVHGCSLEVGMLLQQVQQSYLGRKVRWFFTGDLVDRGPNSIGCLYGVPLVTDSSRGSLILGNHEKKLIKYLLKSDAIETFNDQDWYKEITSNDKDYILKLLEGRPTAVRIKMTDGSYICIGHGATPHSLYQEFNLEGFFPISKKEANVCLYGNTNGEKNPKTGYPVRLHRGVPLANWYGIYGHIVHDKDNCIRRNEPGTSVYVDNGCVFGGYLSAAVFEPGQEFKMFSIRGQEYFRNDTEFAKACELL